MIFSEEQVQLLYDLPVVIDVQIPQNSIIELIYETGIHLLKLKGFEDIRFTKLKDTSNIFYIVQIKWISNIISNDTIILSFTNEELAMKVYNEFRRFSLI